MRTKSWTVKHRIRYEVYNRSNQNRFAFAIFKENILVKRIVPENYSFGVIKMQSPCGNPIRIYDLERTLCDILRGSGSDIQIVGAAMKKYAASKEKDIHKLIQYAEQLHVKPKGLRYMEILL